MFDIGRQVLGFLVAYPALIPVYLVALYWIVIRPFLTNRESRKLESSTLRDIADPMASAGHSEIPVPAPATAVNLDAFFRFTQQSWAQGDLAKTLGDKPRETAQERSLDEFRALFARGLPALEYAFKDYPPGPDEFLIDAYYISVGVSFALTNRHFSFFNMDKGLLSMGGNAVRIPLNAIKKCDVYKKIVTYKIELTLKEFEVLELTVPYDLPGAYIQKVIEPESAGK